MAHPTELSAYQKIMAALDGTSAASKAAKAKTRKGAPTVKMGSSCTPKGGLMIPGSTPCPPAKPKAAPAKGVFSSMFGT